MRRGPPLPVIVNAAGGAASRAGQGLFRQIEDAFASAAQPNTLELVDGAGLAEALAHHAGAPRLAVGGGDGTLGAAAEAVVGTGGELAILPLGTRNHLARQLGIPLELQAAAKVAVEGLAHRIDLGEAGDRIFVNNLSFGAYVELVRQREASRLPKLLATIPAAWRTLRKLRSRTFELTIDGEGCSVRTPLLFVGNNRYEVEEGHPGERDTLDDGRLSVYAVAPHSRTALVVTALRTLAGHPRMHRDFVLERTAQEVRIDGPGATLEAALDGETIRLDLPLSIRIRPRTLEVVRPEGN
jgi:diacylglycerol kinase family enzyme